MVIDILQTVDMVAPLLPYDINTNLFDQFLQYFEEIREAEVSTGATTRVGAAGTESGVGNTCQLQEEEAKNSYFHQFCEPSPSFFQASLATRYWKEAQVCSLRFPYLLAFSHVS